MENGAKETATRLVPHPPPCDLEPEPAKKGRVEIAPRTKREETPHVNRIFIRLLRSGKECPSTRSNGNQAARSSAQLNHAPENRVEPTEENPREGYTRWEELTSGCLEKR